WPPLLEELLRVECELRRRAGEEPSPEEYSARFSQHAALVAAVFGAGAASLPSTSRDGPVGARRARSSGAAGPADSPPPELANHADYEIARKLGEGGMGVVYLAYNRLMDRDEVLKVIGQQIIEQPGVLDRFLREIRAVARLRHPNIVSAYTALHSAPSRAFPTLHIHAR